MAAEEEESTLPRSGDAAAAAAQQHMNEELHRVTQQQQEALDKTAEEERQRLQAELQRTKEEYEERAKKTEEEQQERMRQELEGLAKQHQEELAKHAKQAEEERERWRAELQKAAEEREAHAKKMEEEFKKTAREQASAAADESPPQPVEASATAPLAEAEESKVVMAAEEEESTLPRSGDAAAAAAQQHMNEELHRVTQQQQEEKVRSDMEWVARQRAESSKLSPNGPREDIMGTRSPGGESTGSDLFAKYDEDGDGSLNREQLEALLHDPAFKRKYPDREIERLLNHLASKQDNTDSSSDEPETSLAQDVSSPNPRSGSAAQGEPSPESTPLATVIPDHTPHTILNPIVEEDEESAEKREVQTPSLDRALRAAAERNDAAAVRRLLSNTVDPNADQGEGRTPLIFAAQKGAIEVMEALIQGGADVRRRADSGQNAAAWRNDDALIAACQVGAVDAAKFLLRSGAAQDIEVMSEYRDHGTWVKCNPLLVSSMAGHAEIVRLLLRQRANPHVAQQDGSTPLHCAVRLDKNEDHAEAVRQLLAVSGVDVKDGIEWTPLMHALHMRSIPMIRTLMRHGAQLEPALQESGLSSNMMEAINQGDIGLLIALLEDKRDPNTPMVEQDAVNHLQDGMVSFTPLCHAIRHEQDQAVLELLDAKADPNQVSIIFRKGKEVYCTPLSLAAQQGRSNFLQLLLERRADVHARVEPGKAHTAIHFAAAAGYKSCVIVLHRAGCAGNHLGPEASRSQHSPAAIARARGFDDVAEYLETAVPVYGAPKSDLEEVAPKDRKQRAQKHAGSAGGQGDAPQMSALWLAADKNDVTSVRRLLTAKCDPNQPEADGRTAIFPAAQAGAAEVVKALIQGRADVRRRASNDPEVTGTWRNDDALTSACQLGHAEVCRLLLDAGASQDVNTQAEYLQGDGTWQSCNPLFTACLGAKASVVQLLLEHQADPNLKLKDGCTALHYIVRIGKPETHIVVLQELLAHRGHPFLEVDARDEHGWTPLLHAIHLGHVSFIRLFLEKGASLDEALKEHPVVKDLVQAVINDDVGLVVALLASRIDPNQAKVQEEAVRHEEAGMVSFTPLCAAIRHNRLVCAMELLRAGANPNLVSIYWKGNGADQYITPLTCAAQYRSVDLVQLLLGHSADINQDVLPPREHTAMHFAAAVGSLEVVKALHQAGCARTLLGSESDWGPKCPAAMARKRGFEEVAAYLENAKPMPCNPNNDPQGLSIHAERVGPCV